MAKPQFGSSNDEPDPGRDEQEVYSELKLPVGKPPVRCAVPTTRRAEQREESQRLPVQLHRGRGRRPHQIDGKERDRLHAENERLMNTALVCLVVFRVVEWPSAGIVARGRMITQTGRRYSNRRKLLRRDTLHELPRPSHLPLRLGSRCPNRRRHALIGAGFILEKSWTFPEVRSPTDTSRRNFSFSTTLISAGATESHLDGRYSLSGRGRASACGLAG